ncbi:MAG: glycosyltransferase family 4 protein [Candidatus Kerfeldbacteria bacterium]
MKIAVYYNLGPGGGKKALYFIIQGILKNNHTVDVYTTSLAEHEFYDLRPLVRTYIIEQVSGVKIIPSHGPLKVLRTIRHLLPTEKAIAKKIHAGQYDVALVTNCRFTQHPQLLRLLHIPVVLYSQEVLRGYYEKTLLQNLGSAGEPSRMRSIRWKTFIISYLLNTWARIDRQNILSVSPEHILVNSFFSRENFMRAYGITPTTCYLGVERQQSRPKTRTERNNYILSVGGFEPTKGHDWVIRALTKIHPDLRPHLEIVGDRGSKQYQKILCDLSAQYGVTTVFHQNIPDAGIQDLYARALMVVCAQWMEPFGFVPIEAQSFGTPVIAVREGGLRETVIDHHGGLLCNRDVDDMAEAISRLLENEKLWAKLSKNGPDFVQERFSWDQTAERIEALLRSAHE